MYKILKKEVLNPTVTRMTIEAPLIAKKAQPGQFVILRVDDKGERIPLTVAGCDRAIGGVDIIFQIVGGTTMALNKKNEGEFLCDFVGPLGTPTELDGLKSRGRGRRRGLRDRFARSKAFARVGRERDGDRRVPQ